MTHQNLVLKEMLKELIGYIDGDYFLSDGGLLGLHREGKLIDYDNDLDLYLLPGTTINIPDNSNLGILNYYMDRKVFRKDVEKHKTNKWLEYLSYLRVLPQCQNMNRAQLLSHAKPLYYAESKASEYSLPYIDIFELEFKNDCYEIPFWTRKNGFKYFKTEVELLQTNNDLGFPVSVPNNIEHILLRQYGDNWKTPDSNFKY